MADAVTSQTIVDGDRYAVIKLTNVSDGTGESAVTKVDVSSLASLGSNTCRSESMHWRIYRKDMVAVHWHEGKDPLGRHIKVPFVLSLARIKADLTIILALAD